MEACVGLLARYFNVKCFLEDFDGNKRFSSVEQVKPLTGALATNKLLDNAERLFDSKLDSPEHLQYRDGKLYATVRDNKLVKIFNNKIEVLADFGKSCCE